MSGSANFVAVKNTRVRLAAATLKCDEWRVTTKLADENDTSNTEGGGFTDREAGLADAECEVNTWHDLGTNPHGTFFVGATIANNRLWVNSGMTVGYNFPEMLVTDVEETGRIKEMVRLKITAKNKGAWAYPGA